MSRLARPSPAVRVFTPICRMTIPAVPAMTAKPTACRGLQRKDASECRADVEVRHRIHTGANTYVRQPHQTSDMLTNFKMFFFAYLKTLMT